MLTRHEHLGRGSDGERVRDLSTGVVHDLPVRRRVVDARYLEASIPATHSASSEVAPSARFIPVNDLPAAAESATSYAVLGSGKTAADACNWLLENDIDAARICWIRPRDAWFNDRRHFQPLDQVRAIMEGISLDAEAAAQAVDVDDLFERLEDAGRFARIDRSIPATMYHGTMLSAGEVEALRQIENVVRLGRVRRIDADRTVLERGEIATSPDVLRGLHGARPEQCSGDGGLPARPDRAPAGQVPLAALQRRTDRRYRGPPGRRRREEPAVPTAPLPEHPG